MKKIVIASDSFKGSLTSMEVARSVEEGIKKVFPKCEVVALPVADGGEGMLDAICWNRVANKISVKAHDPLMQEIETSYGISRDNETAFIEMAAINGLPLVPTHKRNPMLTTTYGVGEVIKDALDRGLRKFVIGIGGSATNDAGLGMLQALGFRFLDQEGSLLERGGQIMEHVYSIDVSMVDPDVYKCHFTIACDVNNPFCGTNGAAYVFARQKGADKKMIKDLDRGMWFLSRILFRFTGEDITSFPGAGAAGGLGGIFVALLDATLKPGIELILEQLEFDNRITGADLIITGEGRADKQTLRGKVPLGILQRSKAKQIPVALIAGTLQHKQKLIKAGFEHVCAVTPANMPLEQSMIPDQAKDNITKAIIQLCKEYHP